MKAALLTLTAAAALAAAAPAPAAAKDTPCQKALKKSGDVIVRSRSAVVFTGKSGYYGCHLKKSKKAFALHICCEREVLKLKGRFLGYTFFGSAPGDETSRLGVYDLLTGKRKLIGGQDTIDRSSFIPKSFVVSSKGGIAWFESANTGEDGPVDVVELHAAGVGASVPDRVLDTATPRTALSNLALSKDELTVTWTAADGTKKSAPLTP